MRVLHDLLDSADDRFVVCDDASGRTAPELVGDSYRWAARLRESDVATGDRVVVLLPNSVTFVAATFGVSRSGAICVPLSPQLPPRRLADVLADCRPRAMVTDALGAALADVAGWRGPALLDDERGPADPDPEDAPPSPIGLIVYTSGSTAAPRGVMCPHESVNFAVQAIGDRLAYRHDDVVFSCLPMSFDYGLYQAFLSARAGCRLVLARSTVGPRLLLTAAGAGATVVPLVTSLARQLCALADRPGTTLPPVRLFTSTGDTLTPADCARLRARFSGAAVVRMFGLTECKRVTIGEPDEDLVAPASVGRALPGTVIEIHDDEGRPLPPGEEGELVVSGDHVMAGYWGDDRLTAMRFGAGPHGRQLRTGDHGSIDGSGRFSFSGRRDDIFKVGSHRVGGTEVEVAAMRVDGVRSAAAVRLPTRSDPVLVVETDLTAAHVRRALAAELGPERAPRRCHVVEAMPASPNGKIDRARLRRLLTEQDGA